MNDVFQRILSGSATMREIESLTDGQVAELKEIKSSPDLRRVHSTSSERGVEDDLVTHLASSETVARDRDVILADAWPESFRDIPFLFSHIWDGLPLGRLVGARKVAGPIRGLETTKQLYNDPDSEHGQFVGVIRRMIQDGFLPAVSVSWNTLEAREPNESDFRIYPGLDRTSLIHTKVDLLEESAVTVPADPYAVTRALDRYASERVFPNSIVRAFKRKVPLAAEQAIDAAKTRVFDFKPKQEETMTEVQVKNELEDQANERSAEPAEEVAKGDDSHIEPDMANESMKALQATIRLADKLVETLEQFNREARAEAGVENESAQQAADEAPVNEEDETANWYAGVVSALKEND